MSQSCLHIVFHQFNALSEVSLLHVVDTDLLRLGHHLNAVVNLFLALTKVLCLSLQIVKLLLQSPLHPINIGDSDFQPVNKNFKTKALFRINTYCSSDSSLHFSVMTSL